MSIGQQNLQKHKKYENVYRHFGWFWGIGVEHETYIMTNKTNIIHTINDSILKNERYSVSYYKVYKQSPLLQALTILNSKKMFNKIPFLVNSHSFLDCDIFNNHKTTYDKIPKLNIHFTGKSLQDYIIENSFWLKENYNKAYMYDGDSIEFMTNDFYCATVEKVINELKTIEKRFIDEINSLPKSGILSEYAPFSLASPRNEPFASYLTNPNCLAMFNNGTIHINITLPTRLGFYPVPFWYNYFVEKHRNLARLIQWFEPLWIAMYGSSDPLHIFDSLIDDETGKKGRFAKGSQRLAVSRYIGIGTFDTETMMSGKYLQIQNKPGMFPWYDELYEETHYQKQDLIGLDLNFNKHYAHGLELRFFDQLSYENLESILNHLVVLCDIAMHLKTIENPTKSIVWIKSAKESLLNGSNWIVDVSYINAIYQACGLKISIKEPLSQYNSMQFLMNHLETIGDGYCKKVMKQTNYNENTIEHVHYGC